MDRSAPPPAREPAGPRLSVLAVVTRPAAGGPEVLLVRRANPPQPGHRGFPGGKVYWDEGVAQAAPREVTEETGIEDATPAVFYTIDLIVRGPTGTHPAEILYH